MANSFNISINIFFFLMSLFALPAQASYNLANHKIDSAILKPTQTNIEIAQLYLKVKYAFDNLNYKKVQFWPAREEYMAYLDLVKALNEDAQLHNAYNVAPLEYNTVGEHTKNHWLYNGYAAFYYQDGPERQKLKLTISSGLVYDADGKLFDTSEARYIPLKADAIVTGKVAFVMDRFGIFYALPFQSQATLSHSSILAGLPVAAAGYLKVKNGEILEITEATSTYNMTDTIFSQALVELEKNGFSNTRTIAKTVSPDSSPNERHNCAAYLSRNRLK